ncbi:dehydrogenase [Mobilicoccus caccae]|uniref:Dehydrogenase n=1 Tax=Mobilicoccus caccae TaxID=1859295 RepID=A0ABQ6IV15_9MICO|nr:dehydrogenase [Mobilicoccus caccae]
MSITQAFLGWPVLRQLKEGDFLGRGPAVATRHTKSLTTRTNTADRVAKSVCPYCAVGCGQNIYVKDEKIVQIEGNPDSPISRGRLCPKGSASEQLVNSTTRQTTVLYRAPHASEWTELSAAEATEMIADRILETRRRTWQDEDEQGRALNRTMGIASLGGATLDNEENYLIKKLFTGLGAVQIENQARI